MSLILTQKVCQKTCLNDWIEPAEGTIFQLLLQQITMVSDMPKIEFENSLTYFLKDSNFWYFSCFVKL